MSKAGRTQQTSKVALDDNRQQQAADLLTWAQAFLFDRKAQNLTPGTIRYYRQKIKQFTDYCDTQKINN